MDVIKELNASIVKTPVVSLQSSSVPAGCRLSLRRQTDAEGSNLTVAHDEILHEAVRRGLARELVLALVEHACTSTGAPQPKGCIFFVRAPIGTISDEQFHADLERLVDGRNMARAQICLEIPENPALFHSEPFSYRGPRRLAKLGFGLALANFGTGVSTFQSLKLLPVTFLQIAPTFVSGLLTDPSSKDFVRGSNEIAHLSGKRTIAAGADSPECMMALRNLGVDYVELVRGAV